MEAIALRVYTKKKQKSAVNVWKQAMLISLANKKEEDQIIEDAQEILALCEFPVIVPFTGRYLFFILGSQIKENFKGLEECHGALSDEIKSCDTV
jgi:hypothetical protein